ncbi:unnamed protein product [Trichogramma brassicae]|uniref:Uncharacterized protein n=1 Tax=Trichogramma brassicae TaxID=86971 RepID=A0A6H5ICN2_9HYME|nr:unnamed protein product [Trichogramma brassicae]
MLRTHLSDVKSFPSINTTRRSVQSRNIAPPGNWRQPNLWREQKQLDCTRCQGDAEPRRDKWCLHRFNAMPITVPRGARIAPNTYGMHKFSRDMYMRARASSIYYHHRAAAVLLVLSRVHVCMKWNHVRVAFEIFSSLLCVKKELLGRGTEALLTIMYSMGIKLGRHSHEYARSEDKKRVLIAEQRASDITQEARIIRRQHQKDALEITDEAKELFIWTRNRRFDAMSAAPHRSSLKISFTRPHEAFLHETAAAVKKTRRGAGAQTPNWPTQRGAPCRRTARANRALKRGSNEFPTRFSYKGEEGRRRRRKIELLLVDAVDCFCNDSRCPGRTFVDFVARSGYVDEPGKVECRRGVRPSLGRVTPLHRLFELHWDLSRDNWLSGGLDALCFKLLKIYDRYDVDYVEEATGVTHFHVACCCLFASDDDQLRIIKRFLELGQDPNHVVRETGYSPLHLALQRNNGEAVLLLLRAGADPNSATREKEDTPLHIMSKKGVPGAAVAETFFRACDESNRLVRVDARNGLNRTPLIEALLDHNEEVAALLLRKGSDPNSVDDEFESTPLHFICVQDQSDKSAGMLFKICHELNLPLRVNAQDNKGKTPLELAIANLLPDTVDVLLDHGTDLSEGLFSTAIDPEMFCHSLSSVVKAASGVLVVAERLEAKGYDFSRNDALTIMKCFAELGLYEKFTVEYASIIDEFYRSQRPSLHFQRLSLPTPVTTGETRVVNYTLAKRTTRTRVVTLSASELLYELWRFLKSLHCSSSGSRAAAGRGGREPLDFLYKAPVREQQSPKHFVSRRVSKYSRACETLILSRSVYVWVSFQATARRYELDVDNSHNRFRGQLSTKTEVDCCGIPLYYMHTKAGPPAVHTTTRGWGLLRSVLARGYIKPIGSAYGFISFQFEAPATSLDLCISILIAVVAAVASPIYAGDEDVAAAGGAATAVEAKKQDKRGLLGLGYGGYYPGAVGYAGHAGLGLGHLGSPYYSGLPLAGHAAHSYTAGYNGHLPLNYGYNHQALYGHHAGALRLAGAHHHAGYNGYVGNGLGYLGYNHGLAGGHLGYNNYLGGHGVWSATGSSRQRHVPSDQDAQARAADEEAQVHESVQRPALRQGRRAQDPDEKAQEAQLGESQVRPSATVHRQRDDRIRARSVSYIETEDLSFDFIRISSILFFLYRHRTQFARAQYRAVPRGQMQRRTRSQDQMRARQVRSAARSQAHRLRREMRPIE